MFVLMVAIPWSRCIANLSSDGFSRKAWNRICTMLNWSKLSCLCSNKHCTSYTLRVSFRCFPLLFSEYLWLVFAVFQDLCSPLPFSLFVTNTLVYLTFLVFALCLSYYTSAHLYPFSCTWFSVSTCVALRFWTNDFYKRTYNGGYFKYINKELMSEQKVWNTISCFSTCQFCSLIYLSISNLISSNWKMIRAWIWDLRAV